MEKINIAPSDILKTVWVKRDLTYPRFVPGYIFTPLLLAFGGIGLIVTLGSWQTNKGFLVPLFFFLAALCLLFSLIYEYATKVKFIITKGGIFEISIFNTDFYKLDSFIKDISLHKSWIRLKCKIGSSFWSIYLKETDNHDLFPLLANLLISNYHSKSSENPLEKANCIRDLPTKYYILPMFVGVWLLLGSGVFVLGVILEMAKMKTSPVLFLIFTIALVFFATGLFILIHVLKGIFNSKRLFELFPSYFKIKSKDYERAIDFCEVKSISSIKRKGKLNEMLIRASMEYARHNMTVVERIYLISEERLESFRNKLKTLIST